MLCAHLVCGVGRQREQRELAQAAETRPLTATARPRIARAQATATRVAADRAAVAGFRALGGDAAAGDEAVSECGSVDG